MVGEPVIVALGNALLDMFAPATPELLKRYKLERDGEVELEEWQMDILNDVKGQAKSIQAGGSALNSCRVIARMSPGSVGFLGSIGSDWAGDKLQEIVKNDGVITRWRVCDGLPTGLVAALLDGELRMLCGNIGASSNYKWEQLSKNAHLLDKATVLYIEGFFITHSFDCCFKLFQTRRQINVFSLSAPYVCNNHTEDILKLLKFVNIVFCNLKELETVGKALHIVRENHCRDINKIVCSINGKTKRHDLKRVNLSADVEIMDVVKGENQLVWIVTDGANPTVCSDGVNAVVFPVPEVVDIVDVTGAGDAFVGGFLGRMVKEEKSLLKDCVGCGIGASQAVIKVIGCSLPPGKPDFV